MSIIQKWGGGLKFRRYTAYAILLPALLPNTLQCRADSWQQTVSSQFTAEFDSNPLLSPTYKGGIWRELFVPGYVLNGTLGADEVRTGLSMEIARSSNEALSQSRDSPTAFLDWSRLVNTSEVGVSTRYSEVATRDATTDPTSLVPGISTRTSRTVSGRWRTALTELNTVTAEGSYESVTYSAGTFVDYTSRSGSMMLSHAVNERNSIFLRILYADFAPSNGTASSRFDSATLGWKWRPSENLESALQLGKYQVSDAETGTLGALTVQYTGQRAVYILNANRQVTPSGLGGFDTFDQLNANWRYDLNERSRTGIDLGWRRSLTTDVLTHTTNIWLQHDLDAYWGFRTYYLQNLYWGGGINDATSNVLGFSFSYTHPDF